MKIMPINCLKYVVGTMNIVFLLLLFMSLTVPGSAIAEIGQRSFLCRPIEVYELTFDGLRMAPADIQRDRTEGRDFIFEEATGWKREVANEIAAQYRVINSGNLLGSPVVAQFGDLNPTFLKFLASDVADPRKFIYFQFGGGMNVFGKCVANP